MKLGEMQNGWLDRYCPPWGERDYTKRGRRYLNASTYRECGKSIESPGSYGGTLFAVNPGQVLRLMRKRQFFQDRLARSRPYARAHFGLPEKNGNPLHKLFRSIHRA